MKPTEIRKFCSKKYLETYDKTKLKLEAETLKKSRKKILSEDNIADIETQSQKEAIKIATMAAIKKFADTEPAEIWHRVYEAHVHRKSGIDDEKTIAKVISANQSWIKSSGHAFEEMIKVLGNAALNKHCIEIILQRDLNTLIKAGELKNEPRDISWLKEQVKSGIFDLYAILQNSEGEKSCFGCIQSKTSIRDRVTRDREPSLHAMQSYFWSIAIVLDGTFLKNPKFISMVNGGSKEYAVNGWHGMYVFSEQFSNDRIYPTDMDFKNITEHALKAANDFRTHRQWITPEWHAAKDCSA